MLLMTASGNWKKARRTNATDSSFPARIPTVTRPLDGLSLAAGASVQDVILTAGGWAGLKAPVPGGAAQNMIALMPYAVGSDNGTFNMRLYGWSVVDVIDNDSSKNLYAPTLLAEFACTLSGTFPGLANTPVVATELFCDTMTLTFGNTNLCQVSSPGSTTADTGIAFAMVDFVGFPVLELTFDIGTGPTSMNCLYRLL